jgi:hypothetical protein
VDAIKYAILISADVVLTACVVHFVYICLSNPNDYVAFDRRLKFRPSRFRDYLRWAYVVVVCLGIGISLYGAITFLFSWIPESLDARSHSQLSQLLDKLEKEAHEFEGKCLQHDGRIYSVDVKSSLRLINVIRHLVGITT